MDPQTMAEVLVADEVIRRITHKALGRSDSECNGDYPHDVYFIGNLRPSSTIGGTGTRIAAELMQKLSPVSFGLETKLEVADSCRVSVSLKWSLFYRIFPSYQEQSLFQSGSVAEHTDPDMDGDEPEDQDDGATTPNTPAASATPQRGQQRDRFAPRFRKLDCTACGEIAILRTGDDFHTEPSEVVDSIQKELKRARDIAHSDPDAFRTSSNNAEEQVRIPGNTLASETSYSTFIGTLGNVVEPVWDIDFTAETRVIADEHNVGLLTIDFTNTTDSTDRPENKENYIFDPSIECTIVDGKIVPFMLRASSLGYREDRRMFGRGRNCAVEMPAAETLRTNHVPVHVQNRQVTRDTPRAEFSSLADDPFPVLDAILVAMKDYLVTWDTALDKHEGDCSFTPEQKNQFLEDRRQFEIEIEGFSQGVEFLRNNQDALYAFQLTNKVFARSGKGSGKDSWRLFQIVFLVSQVPGITDTTGAHPDRSVVDIIYFPTGGGKTEAYLGVTVFNCFWDRLRGKTAGVTAWARFPLRLLTVQQTQRFADILGTAELVRREQEDGRLVGQDVDGFSIGYFVGERGTPNKLEAPVGNQPPNPNWSTANDPGARQKWKTIARCPACQVPVQVDFDLDSVRLIHRCTSADCPFPKGRVPVYVVDNEIYRYLPTVIVGTVDRLAILGIQQKVALLTGAVNGRCPKHGYYQHTCCQKPCQETLVRRKPKGISGPTLLIQDELHLLREGLGTFDSHYLSLLAHLLRAAGNAIPPKILASSATIEAFQRQVEHLYDRPASQARRFPGPGPESGESFYATTMDYPQRIYVGILPHNKTILRTMFLLIDYYCRTIYDLAEHPGTLQIPNGVDARSVVDKYWASIVYCLRNWDINAMRTDLADSTNQGLAQDGLPELQITEMTGYTDTEVVTQALEKFQMPGMCADGQDVILATSMISHGVDVDRLNAMFFFGMPRQNSEYVQSSSRVGRRHVGIVFTCFVPARERDQSHYAYFAKYHEYLGRMIEPVAINRWAKYSLDRTLPGVFNSILLVENAGRGSANTAWYYYNFKRVKEKIASGEITVQDLMPPAADVYLARGAAVAPNGFRGRIEDGLQRIVFDQIAYNSGEYNFVSDALDPPPMTSLRDVDEQVPIYLDSIGTDWARARQRRGGG